MDIKVWIFFFVTVHFKQFFPLTTKTTTTKSWREPQTLCVVVTFWELRISDTAKVLVNLLKEEDERQLSQKPCVFWLQLDWMISSSLSSVSTVWVIIKKHFANETSHLREIGQHQNSGRPFKSVWFKSVFSSEGKVSASGLMTSRCYKLNQKEN